MVEEEIACLWLGVWCTPVIQAFRKLRQEDYTFEAILGYDKILSKKKIPLKSDM